MSTWTPEQLRDHAKRDALISAKQPAAKPLPEQFKLHAEESEKALQKEIIRQLEKRDLAYDQKRMDKKSTGVVGCPDFIVCLPGGKFLAIECKVGKNDLSEAQSDFRNRVEMNGGLWMTVWDAEPVRQILNAYCV